MTIRPNILQMSTEALEAFIAERRSTRAIHYYKLTKKPSKEPLTVAKIARDLGIDRHALAKRLEGVLVSEAEVANEPGTEKP